MKKTMFLLVALLVLTTGLNAQNIFLNSHSADISGLGSGITNELTFRSHDKYGFTVSAGLNSYIEGHSQYYEESTQYYNAAIKLNTSRTNFAVAKVGGHYTHTVGKFGLFVSPYIGLSYPLSVSDHRIEDFFGNDFFMSVTQTSDNLTASVGADIGVSYRLSNHVGLNLSLGFGQGQDLAFQQEKLIYANGQHTTSQNAVFIEQQLFQLGGGFVLFL